MELSENCPTDSERGQELTERNQRSKKKVWEWSTVETGRFVYRKPFFEAGKWRVRRIEKATGKIQRLTLEASTLREARKELSELADNERCFPEKGEGESGTKKIAITTAIQEWISTLDTRNTTHEYYRKMTNALIKIIGKDKLVNELEFAEIESIFSVNLKSRKGRTKIAYYHILKRFFDWCVKRNYCEKNLARMIEIPKKWSIEEREGILFTGQALTFEEAKKLLQACRKRTIVYLYEKKDVGEEFNYLWWFVFISLRTGLRRSNIVGNEFKPPLKWKNIDLKNKTIKIDKKFMKNGMEFETPIHDELAIMLEKRIARFNKIPSPEDNLVDINEVDPSFKKALEKAGLGEKKFRAHDLRHTFGTWLGEHCPYMVMKRLMGHSPSSITEKYSWHQSMEVLREGLNKLPWLTEKVEAKGDEKIS